MHYKLSLLSILVTTKRLNGSNVDNKNSEYIESTIAKDVMLAYNDEDGNIYYSADGGETFFNEKEFNEKYPSPEVEWWTYEEYK